MSANDGQGQPGDGGPTLLVVHHSPTPKLEELLGVVLSGARHPDIEGVTVKVVEALEATSEDVLAADAYLLGTTANFGYISGAMKHFFDSTFLECHEETKGRPVSWWIRGGQDVTGAVKAMRSITTGFGWEVAAEPVEFVGDLDEEREELLVNLGGSMAAMLMGE